MTHAQAARIRRSLLTRALASLMIGAAALTLLASPASAKDEIRVEDVRFAPGASSATIKSSLKGYTTVKYRVRAAAGQVMTVKLTGSNPQNYFNVLPPGSEEAIFIGSSAIEQAWSGTLAQSGDYTVVVYLMRAAARRNESSRYTLEVAVTGTKATAAPVSDAKVKGTPFHATGDLRCRIAQAKAACPFGVIRGGAGVAQVQVTLPDGSQRVFAFAGGKVSLEGSSAALTASHAGDTWKLSIGGKEEFEIPDAVITGG